MSLKKLETSLRLDLIGNLFEKSQQLTNRLSRLGSAGSLGMRLFSKSFQAVDSGLDKLANRYTAVVTGVGATAAVRNVSSLQMRLTRLGIQAGRTDEEMAALNDQIFRISQQKDINIDPSELYNAIEKIVSKTGDLDFATANMKNLAYAIQAAGAAGEDVGAMAGDIFQKFGIEDPEKMREAMSKLVNQGKMGAFELKDLASQGERLMSAYAATGRTGQEGLDEMGALAQMARQSTGSREQATTAIDALIRNYSDITRQKKLKSIGIKLYEDDDPNKMRSIIGITQDLIKKTNGKQSLIGNFVDQEGIKAIRAIMIEYNKTKEFKSLNSFLKASSDSAALLNDAARAAEKFDPNIDKLRATFKEFIYSRMERSLSAFARAVNSIDHDKMQRYLSNATKLLITLGTVAVANKVRHGLLNTVSFFRGISGKEKNAGSAVGAITSMSRPIPVFVVNAAAIGMAGAMDGLDMAGGAGKAGKFGKIGRFMARHRRLAALAGFGGKALKYGSRGLGVLGMGYSVYEATQAENGSQLGGSVGSLAGGIIGSFAGPFGMIAGAYIGNYLGEKIGGMFDELPKENTKALKAEKTINAGNISKSEARIRLEVNSNNAEVKLKEIEENNEPGNMCKLDLSLGGRF